MKRVIITVFIILFSTAIINYSESLLAAPAMASNEEPTESKWCGSQGKMISQTIPDSWNFGHGPFDITQLIISKGQRNKIVYVGNACKKHDHCYGTPSADKTECDEQFSSDLLDGCRSKSTLSKSEMISCTSKAISYYEAVKFSGGEAFNRAQKSNSKIGLQSGNNTKSTSNEKYENIINKIEHDFISIQDSEIILHYGNQKTPESAACLTFAASMLRDIKVLKKLYDPPLPRYILDDIKPEEFSEKEFNESLAVFRLQPVRYIKGEYIYKIIELKTDGTKTDHRQFALKKGKDSFYYADVTAPGGRQSIYRYPAQIHTKDGWIKAKDGWLLARDGWPDPSQLSDFPSPRSSKVDKVPPSEIVKKVMVKAITEKGSIQLPVLKSANYCFLLDNQEEKKYFDFHIRCDKITIRNSTENTPSTIDVRLTIVENEKEIINKTLHTIIGDGNPDSLTYKGVTFYNTSYQSYNKDFIVTVKKLNSEPQFETQLIVPFQEKTALPKVGVEFGVINGEVKAKIVNKVKIYFTDKQGEASVFWVKVGQSKIIERPSGDFSIEVGQMHSAGLSVSW